MNKFKGHSLLGVSKEDEKSTSSLEDFMSCRFMSATMPCLEHQQPPTQVAPSLIKSSDEARKSRRMTGWLFHAGGQIGFGINLTSESLT